MKKFIIPTLASLCFISALQASPLEDLIVSGNTFWSQGKLAEAETEFKKALKINPDSGVAHARMANLYLTQNKTTEAVEEFQNAINADPENPNLFIGLAITYLHKKYYQMAEAMVKQAIELNPELANAQKLQAYIDAKKERMSQPVATAPQDSTHGGTSMHGKAATPHGQVNSSMPATIQKNLKDTH